MKTPDKLYISHLIYDTWQYQTPDTDDETQIEYIRKDALLEWAKGEIMPGNSAEGKGWNMALQTLIEKLESL